MFMVCNTTLFPLLENITEVNYQNEITYSEIEILMNEIKMIEI